MNFSKETTKKGCNSFLYNDVLQYIFLFLHWTDISTVSQVCRKWKLVVEKYGTSGTIWFEINIIGEIENPIHGYGEEMRTMGGDFHFPNLRNPEKYSIHEQIVLRRIRYKVIPVPIDRFLQWKHIRLGIFLYAEPWNDHATQYHASQWSFTTSAVGRVCPFVLEFTTFVQKNGLFFQRHHKSDPKFKDVVSLTPTWYPRFSTLFIQDLYFDENERQTLESPILQQIVENYINVQEVHLHANCTFQVKTIIQRLHNKFPRGCHLKIFATLGCMKYGHPVVKEQWDTFVQDMKLLMNRHISVEIQQNENYHFMLFFNKQSFECSHTLHSGCQFQEILVQSLSDVDASRQNIESNYHVRSINVYPYENGMDGTMKITQERRNME